MVAGKIVANGIVMHPDLKTEVVDAMVAARDVRPIHVLILAMITLTMTLVVPVYHYPASRLFLTTLTEMKAVSVGVCTQMDRSGLVVVTTVMIGVLRPIQPLLHRRGIKRYD